MPYLRFSLVVLNGVLFMSIAVLSLHYRSREPSLRTRRLWGLVAVVSGALVVGAIQRSLVQAAALGWLSPSLSDDAVTNWQLAQSIVVAVLAVLAFTRIRRLASDFAATERVAGSIVDRVRHVSLENLSLSPRESEILGLIGTGLLSDAELCGVLHISPSTVQTHVKSLLRKTGLNSRKDLIAVAHIVDGHE